MGICEEENVTATTQTRLALPDLFLGHVFDAHAT